MRMPQGLGAQPSGEQFPVRE